MKKVIILGIVGLIAGGLVGYKFGKTKARKTAYEAVVNNKVENGKWSYNGAGNAAFTDFILATQCVLGGNDEQSILFTTNVDADGNPLEAGKQYKIFGKDFPSKNWSVTAYNPNHLIKSQHNKFYVSRKTVSMDTLGNWEALVATTPQQGNNWIYNGAENGSLILALRIYNPKPEATENVGALELPEITKIN